MPEETQENQSAESQSPQTPEPPKQDLPEIEVATEEIGTLKKKVTVTVPRKRIDAKFNDMFGEMSHSALVPGFRIGHAPRRLIEKRFGKEISQDVRNSLVGESLGQAVEKAALNTLGEPNIDLDKIELPEQGDLSYSFEVEVAPEFELPELKGIKVSKPKIEVTEERLNQQLDQWRQGQATYEATDAAAAEGDAVVADARISGEGVAGVDRKDLTMRVAPGQVEGLPLVELGKTLAGKKAGETASTVAKVPQVHPNEEWRGKDVTVDLTVKQVRRRVLPEINEDFARNAGFDSLQALREYVRGRMDQHIQFEIRKSMRDQICKHLVENTKFELPEGVAERHTSGALRRRMVELLQAGVPREEIEEHMTELQANVASQARAELKLSFILGKVAEVEKVQVDEGEVNARIADMARQYRRRPERLRQELEQEGALDQVQISILEDKALDKLLEQAEVSELSMPPVTETEEPEQKPKAEKAEKHEKAEKGEKSEKAEKAHKAKKVEEPAAKTEKEPKAAKKAAKEEEPAKKSAKPAGKPSAKGKSKESKEKKD